MGRYLACGIATQIQVYRNSKTEEKDLEDLDTIKSNLNKYFSLDNYELDTDKYTDAFIFTIKKDYLEKNIHKVIAEISKLYRLDLSYVFSEENIKIDFSSKDFCQKNYPLELKKVKEHDREYLKIVGKANCLDDFPPFDDPTWLYSRNGIFGWYEKYRVNIFPAAIWIDIDKYIGEDETNMLLALNSMKNSYFKTPLSSNIFFFIYG